METKKGDQERPASMRQFTSEVMASLVSFVPLVFYLQENKGQRYIYRLVSQAINSLQTEVWKFDHMKSIVIQQGC